MRAYTDAFGLLLSATVKQVPLRTCPAACRPTLLAAMFSLRLSTNHQLRWSPLEKEAFTIMSTVVRMHWLFAIPDGFDLYNDRHNLIFPSDPTPVVPGLSQTLLCKVLRWAERFSAYNFACEHIKEVNNIWADLCGRWSAPVAILRLVNNPSILLTQIWLLDDRLGPRSSLPKNSTCPLVAPT